MNKKEHPGMVATVKKLEKQPNQIDIGRQKILTSLFFFSIFGKTENNFFGLLLCD